MSQDLTQGRTIPSNSVWRSRRSSAPGRGAQCREYPSASEDGRRDESDIWCPCLKNHGPSSRLWRCEVLRQVLVHLEHRHLLLAEHRLQLVVRQDLAPVFRVLQIMLLDVLPNFAHDLAARQGLGPDHSAQLLRGLQELLKGIGLPAFWDCRFCFAAFFLGCLGCFGWLRCLGFFRCFGFFGCLSRHGCPPRCWVCCL